MKIVIIAVIFCITGNPCVWRDHTGRNACASSAYANVSAQCACAGNAYADVSNQCACASSENTIVSAKNANVNNACANVKCQRVSVKCNCVSASNRCVAVNIECVAVRRINITNKDGVYKNTTRCLRATGGLAQAGV